MFVRDAEEEKTNKEVGVRGIHGFSDEGAFIIRCEGLDKINSVDI